LLVVLPAWGAYEWVAWRQKEIRKSKAQKGQKQGSSREAATIPLIQFLGGWKWYPVLSRGLTMDAGTDGGGAASASRLRWMTCEAPASCSATTASSAHGAKRTRCGVPITS